jgi:hypothetical protein
MGNCSSGLRAARLGLTVTLGGTGLTAGVQGAIPWFNATNTMAATALLAANSFMIGGGTGAAPSTVSTYTYVSGIVKLAENSTAAFEARRASTDTTGPYFSFYKARGTQAAPSVISSGDSIGIVSASAYHASAGYALAGQLRFTAEGAASGSTVPVYYSVEVMSSGGSLTEAYRVNSTREFGIGRTAASGMKLDVNGLIRSYDGTVDARLNGTSTIGIVGTYTNHPVGVYVNGTERARFGNPASAQSLELITGGGSTKGLRVTHSAAVTSEGAELTYLNTGNTTVYLDSLYNNAGASLQIRLRTAGTPVVALAALGSGYVGLGGITAPEGFLHIQSNSAEELAYLEYNASDVYGPITYYRKSRGTKASPAIPSLNDICGATVFSAYSSAGTPGYRDGAYVMGKVDGALASYGMPMRLEFYTTLGGGSMALGATLDSASRFTVGAAANQSGHALEVQGWAAIAYSASNIFGAITLRRKSRGSITACTAVVAGDSVGANWHYGHNGSDFVLTYSDGDFVQYQSGSVVSTYWTQSLQDRGGTLRGRVFQSVQKALTDNVACNILTVPCASGTANTFFIKYTVEYKNATEWQTEVGYFLASCGQKSSTWNNGIGTVTSLQKVSPGGGGGTLAVSFAWTNANPAVLSVTADTSLGSLTLAQITYTIECLGTGDTTNPSIP